MKFCGQCGTPVEEQAAFFNFINALLGMGVNMGRLLSFLDALATAGLVCAALWLLFIASKKTDAMAEKSIISISLLKFFFLVSLAWHATGLFIQFIGSLMLFGGSSAISQLFGYWYGQGAAMFFDMILYKGTKVVFMLFGLLMILKLEKSYKENKADTSAALPFAIGCFAHAGGGFLAALFCSGHYLMISSVFNIFVSMLIAGALVLFGILTLQTVSGNK